MKKILLMTALMVALCGFCFAQTGRWNYDSISSQIDGARVIYINSEPPYVSGRSYQTSSYPNAVTGGTSGFISDTLYLYKIQPRQNATINGFVGRVISGGSNTNVLFGVYNADSQNNPSTLITSGTTSITPASGYYQVNLNSNFVAQKGRLYYYGVIFNTSGTIPSIWAHSPASCASDFANTYGASGTTFITGLATGGCGFLVSGVSATLGISTTVISSTLTQGSGTTGAPYFRMIVK